MKKNIQFLLFVFASAFLVVACGGGGGGGGSSDSSDSGGGDSGDSGDSGGGDSGDFTAPSRDDLDGQLLTFDSDNGITIQARFDSTLGADATDLVTGDTINIGYSELGGLSAFISKSPIGQSGPFYHYDFDTVTWTSATTADLSGTFDDDDLDGVPGVPVTASLTVSP